MYDETSSRCWCEAMNFILSVFATWNGIVCDTCTDLNKQVKRRDDDVGCTFARRQQVWSGKICKQFVLSVSDCYRISLHLLDFVNIFKEYIFCQCYSPVGSTEYTHGDVMTWTHFPHTVIVGADSTTSSFSA